MFPIHLIFLLIINVADPTQEEDTTAITGIGIDIGIDTVIDSDSDIGSGIFFVSRNSNSNSRMELDS